MSEAKEEASSRGSASGSAGALFPVLVVVEEGTETTVSPIKLAPLALLALSLGDNEEEGGDAEEEEKGDGDEDNEDDDEGTVAKEGDTTGDRPAAATSAGSEARERSRCESTRRSASLPRSLDASRSFLLPHGSTPSNTPKSSARNSNNGLQTNLSKTSRMISIFKCSRESEKMIYAEINLYYYYYYCNLALTCGDGRT